MHVQRTTSVADARTPCRHVSLVQVLFLEKDIYHEIAAESERFAEYVETEAIKQEQVRHRKR